MSTAEFRETADGFLERALGFIGAVGLEIEITQYVNERGADFAGLEVGIGGSGGFLDVADDFVFRFFET